MDRLQVDLRLGRTLCVLMERGVAKNLSCINVNSCKAMKAQTQVTGTGGNLSSGGGPALQDSLDRIRSKRNKRKKRIAVKTLGQGVAWQGK